MSDEIEAAFRRGAEEQARREELKRREQEAEARHRVLSELFNALEQFRQTNHPPTDQDLTRYADLLIRLCGAALEYGLTTGAPDADRPGDGPLLAAKVLHFAFIRDADGIKRIVRGVAEADPGGLGDAMVQALLDLIRRKVLWCSATPAAEEAGSYRDEAGAGGAEGDDADKAEAISALPASLFRPEKLDPSRCPECKTPVPERFRTLAIVPCLNCRQWELHTGLVLQPVAGPPGTPPEPVRLSAPFWQPRLPDLHDSLPLGGAGSGGKNRRERGRPPGSRTAE